MISVDGAWTPACASGEEAYSVVQALNEELRATNDQLNFANEELNEANARLRGKIDEIETQSNVLCKLE